jgi:hypothetical protein
VQVRRELGLELLESNESGRATRRSATMKERHAELLLIVMIACGVGADVGMLVAWMTLN